MSACAGPATCAVSASPCGGGPSACAGSRVPLASVLAVTLVFQ